MAVFLANTELFSKNDLQAAAAAYSSEVGEALRLLDRHVGPSRMSGSGSAVFAGAGEDPGANDVFECSRRVLATLPSGWTGRLCRSLTVHPLKEWAED
jgi:4-diphosphocytidyl-2-C-methyl-D-erythritol kinase